MRALPVLLVTLILAPFVGILASTSEGVSGAGSATTLQGSYGIDVTVTNRKGEPVYDAEITLSGPIGQGIVSKLLTKRKGVTNTSGLAALSVDKAGDYEVVIHHKDYRTFTSVVTLSDAKFRSGYSAVMSQQAAYWLDVLVTDKDGKPLGNSNVTLSYLGTAALAGVQSPSVTRVTDGDGKVDFGLSDEGEWKIVITHDNYDAHSGIVHVEDTLKRASYAAKLGSRSARLVVSVLNEGGDPIEGAVVQAKTLDGLTSAANRTSTNDLGMAYIILKADEQTKRGETIQVTVSHPDYEGKTGTVNADRGIYRDYDCPFKLKRKASRQVVNVEVTDTLGQPINGANIKLLSSRSVYNGSTDASGKAAITVRESGEYGVTVTRTGYESAKDSLTIKGYDDDAKTYNLAYELAQQKRDWRRGVRVTVRGKDKSGKSAPVANAQLMLSNGQGGTTNGKGVWEFYHRVPAGEELRVTVTDPSGRFDNGVGSVLVGAKGTLVDPDASKIDLSKSTAVEKINVELKPKGGRITGDVIASKGRAKPNENVPVTVAVLYSGSGSKTAKLTHVVELYGPKGNRLKAISEIRTVKQDQYDRRTLNMAGGQPGTYTVKVKVSGAGGEWTDSAKFDVVGAAVNQDKPGEEPTEDFSGIWRDDDGRELHLTQSGTTITGKSSTGRSTITGTVKGSKLFFTVTEISTGKVLYTGKNFRFYKGDRNIIRGSTEGAANVNYYRQ